MADQIVMGQFEYPSPYWDSIGDPALDLIDRMLTVDVADRITIDGCLEHPWLTKKYPCVTDSTEGLTGAFGQLDFSKRKVKRERTLLSNMHEVKSSNSLKYREDQSQRVKLFGKKIAKGDPYIHGKGPSDTNWSPKEFINMGGRGDPSLFSDSSG